MDEWQTRDTLSGIVFNIQRYSLHDGPGIRTVVFLMGCPLRCAWCSNPESFSSKPKLIFNAEKCLGDGRCLEVCPTGAKTRAGVNYELCILCGRCVDVCPSNALELLGKEMTIPEILEEVEKDRKFYEDSGGGVTLSGGEVLAQWMFAAGCMQELRSRYIHVAIETSGYGPWDQVSALAEVCDLILFDLKIMDDMKHREYTGVSNRIILENAEKIAALEKHIIFRVPLVGGINDDDENMEEIARFAQKTGVNEVHLLPYHRFGESKYVKLNMEYGCSAVTPDEKRITQIHEYFSAQGLRTGAGNKDK